MSIKSTIIALGAAAAFLAAILIGIAAVRAAAPAELPTAGAAARHPAPTGTASEAGGGNPYWKT